MCLFIPLLNNQAVLRGKQDLENSLKLERYYIHLLHSLFPQFLRYEKTVYEDLSLLIKMYSPKLQNATLNKFDDFTYLHNKNH